MARLQNAPSFTQLRTASATVKVDVIQCIADFFALLVRARTTKYSALDLVVSDKFGFSFGSLSNGWTKTKTTLNGSVTGEIISTALDASKNAYVVEYTLNSFQGAAQQHLLTVFSLMSWRFMLPIIGQMTEEDRDSEAALMRRV
eukprot:IDg12549t1